MELRLRLSLGSRGRTIWIVDAHRDDGKRFVVRADEMLTAFLERQGAIHGEIDLVKTSPLLQIALVLVRFKHIARFTGLH